MKKHYAGFLFSLIFFVPNEVFGQGKIFELLPAKKTGIAFVNTINDNENLNIMAYEYFYNGGGVAVGDLNNDGLDDLFFTANMSENKLYLNQGGMKFKDITASAGKGLEGRKDGWKTGATMADVNGDGLLDIYVCYSGKVEDEKRKNELFINQGVSKGSVRFVEQAAAYGLDNVSYSTQAAFFDYDKDGDLDMMLLNHTIKKIDNMELAKFRTQTDALAGNKFFENRDNHFVDISEKVGIKQFPLTFGLGIAVADINMDGWQDIYVTNDYNEPDYLYINNGNGTFREDSQNCFRHLAQFSMGIDIGDFNNDGLPDVMSLDMLPEDNRRQKLLQLQENYEAFDLMMSQNLYKQYMRNMLQLNNGDGTFSEIAQVSGVSNTDWSWTPLFADFDNDGFKDLFVSNGYYRDYTNKDFLRYWGDYKIRRAVDKKPTQLMDLVNAMPSTRLANYIFRNNKDLTFTQMQETWGMPEGSVSSGAVYADLDNDGDLDMVVNNINDPAFIYQNKTSELSNQPYIQVKLVQKSGNRNAIGAKVLLTSKGRKQYQEVSPSRGYLSSLPLTLHFGLGDWKGEVDAMTITWPDGSVQVLTDVKLNQKLVIDKPENISSKLKAQNEIPKAVFAKSDSPVTYSHNGFDENDFKRQPLMLSMYSQTGPVVIKGDVNKDGLADLFISGDEDKQANIWIQKKDGTFEMKAGFAIGDENVSATSAALFFDANGDGYEDLYVAKGGYSMFEPNTFSLQDEIYLSDGKGNLNLAVLSLPNLKASSKSCVRAADFDKDGDLDLFVGGRVVPGRYPETPQSFLLINNGKGVFSIRDAPFSKLGMITDAKWVDMDRDGKLDMVLCGEYMPIKIFLNTGTGFVDKTLQFFGEEESGFWNTIMVEDINGDGAPDILGGNMGLNTQIKVSRKEPATLYFADFDKNGSLDPFFCFFVQGKSYPFVSRDELNDQMFPMRKKFTSYKDYAEADIHAILPDEQLDGAEKREMTEAKTVVFLSNNGKLEKTELPLQAQFAPVTHIMFDDYDADGKKDLLLLGNKSNNRLKLGSMDANFGCLLKWSNGKFEYMDQVNSGLSVGGDVKSVVELKDNGKKTLLIGSFNMPFQFYQYK